jgi:hypothetical protein
MWFKKLIGISASSQARHSLRGASTSTLSLETLEQRETPSGGLVPMQMYRTVTPAASMVASFQVAPVNQTVDYGALRW